MEVHDGFIVSIFNYCDRWCERCQLTNRCQIFADRVEDEFERDQGPLGEQRRERMAREMGEAAVRWEKELGINFEEIQREAEKELASMSEEDRDAMFEVSLDHLELETRAQDFGSAVYQWIRNVADDQYGTSLPLQVLGRFWIFVGGKVHRALMGLKDAADDELNDASDAHGSAKAALIALEEMRSACDALMLEGRMAMDTRDDLVGRIDWLLDSLDTTLPGARTFIRPGLDELEAIAELEAKERG